MLSRHMYCFQCQETARQTGCTSGGVCGKSAVCANIMDKMIRQLKSIAIAHEPNLKLGRFIIQSLFMTVTNTNFDEKSLLRQLKTAEKLTPPTETIIPLGVLAEADENLRSLKELLTCGVKGIAAYAEHAAVLGKEDMVVYDFIFKALRATAADHSMEHLISLVMECGAVAEKAMALLDTANTTEFGVPRRTRIRVDTGTRPGILVSGHDLKDLHDLLTQTIDLGIDIYTHGEMLPAHFYPELQKYPHLYGNYGNAWHQQSKDFAAFNGPVLMTTNCITPPASSYRKRLFTTGACGFPGIPHIPAGKAGHPKDFSPLIDIARTAPPPTPLEQGRISGGFAHGQLAELTGQILAAVRTGAIRRFIVMAGCDGRYAAREYYTDLAQRLPGDTIILTAGCAKYRYHQLQLGEINGIPRILDAGQCNDCYSLLVFARELKKTLDLDDINKLPVSFDIAWYEQKAVAVLLALLAAGFKNIRLGPTLPAFLSPAVAEMLTNSFGLRPIGEINSDIHAMMKGK